MKRVKLKLLSTVLLGIFMTAEAEELKLNISNINVKKGGNIAVYLFVDKEGYPKVHKEAKFFQIKKVANINMEFKFELPEDIKNVAVKVHHDINSDGKVTKNWTGIIPKDGLGFSNGQELSIKGVPSYDNSKLTKKDFTKVEEIKIRYYSD